MAFGKLAVDYEQRVDYDRLRKERLQRAKDQINKDGLGALVTWDEANIRYLTSYYVTTPLRVLEAQFAFCPRNGEPHLIGGGTWREVERRMPWMKGRVHGTVGLPRPAAETPDDPVLNKVVDQIAGLMAEYGVEKEPLGLDGSTLAYLYAEAFKKRGIKVVHGKPTMDLARMIKTADEIELMRITCANSEKAFAAIVDAIRPGVRECDLVAIGIKALYEEGDDHTEDLVCMSGYNTNPYGWSFTDKPIRPGDLIYIEYIEGLSELVQVIHKHGCPTFMQMVHLGSWQNPLFPNEPPVSNLPPVGASPVKLDAPGDFQRDLLKELTIPEIEEIVDKYASAAVRAQKAGFDGVDINAGSTHLMHNFLSPFWNRREDAYGGSREKRARFLTEIIQEIKKRCGKEFPVCVCMNGIEIGRTAGIDDNKCMTVEDSQGLAKIIEAAGADAIQVRNQWLGYHVGGFLPDYLFYPEPPIPLKEFPKEYNASQRGAGANIYLAEGMKKNLSIPVIVVGKLGPELGEKVLREGKADFIAMTRGIFADPELPNKVAAGRLEDIAPCTACGTCLDQTIQMKRRCRINAAIATEKYTIDKAEKRKRVVVLGGGPAGMEAARVAALRGHEVTLYEKSSKLGGYLDLAALIKGVELEDLPGMVRYLKIQLDKLGVKTKLGKEVNSALIEEIKPDVVIVATGGTLTVPEITGINSKNVVTTPTLHRQAKPLSRLLGPRILGWLTKFWLPIGKKVVIIGGGVHGCEIAEFLIKRGRKVTIVDTAETIGEGMIDFRLGLFLDWYNKKGGALITGVKDMKITDEGLVITTKDGEKQTLQADSIIPTSPLAPNTELLKSLEGEAPEVYAIGDCQDPRMIVDAIADGWEIANKI